MGADGFTLVTGATGFVGSHVAAKLAARGERVRVLTRGSSSRKNLEGIAAEVVQGDLTDPASLKQAMAGCRRLYHVAADYRLWAPDPAELYRNNVTGTRNILEAAREARVGRVVYTSTVGALKVPENGRPSNEETPVGLQDMIGHYKRSKFLAEQEAVAAARAGLDLVIVNPSTPVGSRDVKPTPTGQMIVDFLNGRMPAYVDTGLNLIDVEDAAEGHLLAMEKGKAGQKYILGHRNLTLKEILEMLARATGLKAPTVRMPNAVAMGVAVLCAGWSRVTGKPPLVSVEAVKMSRKKMYFDPAKAVRELGLPQRPVEQALANAVEWFRKNGYVK